MPDKVTIQDIARLAGVSKATVSRVINQKPDVDAITRERILRLMDQHAFVPSIAASGLAGGRTHLLGVIFPSLTWPLMPQLMAGIGEHVERTSYELVLFTMRPNLDHRVALDRIVGSKMTDALLAIYPGSIREPLVDLYEQGFPIVIIDDQGPVSSLPWVGTDQRFGAKQVVRHLIEQGHRDIAYISGPKSYMVSYDRQAGYLEALHEAGIEARPELIAEGDFKPPTGYVCGRALLELPQRPTAIFAGNDEMAYGVMQAAEEFNLRIPDDLALAGFDDITTSAHVRPPLTTIRQPLYDMGQQSIALLISLLEAARNRIPPSLHSLRASDLDSSRTAPEPARIQIPSTLVVRASSAPGMTSIASGASITGATDTTAASELAR